MKLRQMKDAPKGQKILLLVDDGIFYQAEFGSDDGRLQSWNIAKDFDAQWVFDKSDQNMSELDYYDGVPIAVGWIPMPTVIGGDVEFN